MRRALAVSAVLSALVLAPGATAAPPVGPEPGSGTEFRLTTRAGSYAVSLLASRPAAGGAAQLRIRLVSPSGAVTRLSGVLPAGGLVTGGGGTTVKARLGSTPLTIVFHPNTEILAASFGDLDSDSSTAEGWTIAGTGGTAEVTLGELRCSVSFIVAGAATVIDPNGYGGPLRNGLGVPLTSGRCGDLPSSTLPHP